MYTQFRVQNFRGFKDLELKDLARINLIAGKNNVGKTSLVEAILAHNGDYSIMLDRTRLRRPLSANHRVGDLEVELNEFKTIFRNFDFQTSILLSGKFISNNPQMSLFPELDLDTYEHIEVRLVPLEKVQNSHLLLLNKSSEVLNIRDTLGLLFHGNDEEIFYLTPYTRYKRRNKSVFVKTYINVPTIENNQRFSNLKRTRHIDLLVEPLRVFEPKLSDLELLAGGIYADIGLTELIPLHSIGQGFGRILTTILAITDSENGIVIIDEIENGLHYSIQKDVWKAIAKAAELFNVQIFATTHSFEMIRAAQEAFGDMDEDTFRFYRLDREDNGDIQAVKYSPKTMSASIEMDFEVRG